MNVNVYDDEVFVSFQDDSLCPLEQWQSQAHPLKYSCYCSRFIWMGVYKSDMMLS